MDFSDCFYIANNGPYTKLSVAILFPFWAVEWSILPILEFMHRYVSKREERTSFESTSWHLNYINRCFADMLIYKPIISSTKVQWTIKFAMQLKNYLPYYWICSTEFQVFINIINTKIIMFLCQPSLFFFYNLP